MTPSSLKDFSVASDTKTITLTDRQLCDIELILDGSFNPLDGFLNKSDYESVLSNMRLSDNSLWPIPICLDLNKNDAEEIKSLRKIDLIDKEGFLIATMNVQDVWKIDKDRESMAVFGSKKLDHPGVYQLHNNTKEYYAGGKLTKVALPTHHNFKELRNTPEKVNNNPK